MKFINKIIDFLLSLLGGISKDQYDSVTFQYNIQRDLVNYSRARIEYLENELKLEREDRKSLQELIYKRFGLIESAETAREAENISPIRTSPRRWSQLKTAMERDDHERVSQDAKVS
jgi:hypothetical protein